MVTTTVAMDAVDVDGAGLITEQLDPRRPDPQGDVASSGHVHGHEVSGPWSMTVDPSQVRRVLLVGDSPRGFACVTSALRSRKPTAVTVWQPAR
jgi:hypothetical protein